MTGNEGETQQKRERDETKVPAKGRTQSGAVE